ncbi:MAG TPA: S8 family peptidase [Planctomycetaceae bacterium]|jgi:hypothetical protein|nr:S8 family peptidase [Planctomycetaceae bacterium]
MDELRHFFPRNTAATEQYTYAKPVRGGDFKVPPRDDRVGHASQLVQNIQSAEQEANAATAAIAPEERPKGVVLDFCSDPGFKLQLTSLEVRQSGIELRNARTIGDVMHGTVFVPEGKVGVFVRKFEAYAKENDRRSGKPKNKPLVESISAVRLASLRSFWTDAGSIPESTNPIWWEVWLRDATNPHDVGDEFRERARAVGIDVSSDQLRFPERRVLLARATTEQLMEIENLFDILAELRLAKVLAGAFLALPPRDQAEIIENVRPRIQPPPADAPAVCHLDTGVNRGHPLIEFALQPEHMLAVNPDWSVGDNRGHGTEMAGLALYGSLTSILNGTGPILLRHRLESVKILPDVGQNELNLYGYVTEQAVSRAEISAPGRARRAFCLTVTTDGRDEGFPSSWSAALDQITSAAHEDVAPRRLVIVSAGNVEPNERHEYPDRNHVLGVEDPAQAWNALSVGACTHLATIQQPGYDGWNPIAQPGRLSPSSRTSLVWADKSWPLKPDVVMEGGNSAIDPSTKHADHVDDLSLLTTRVSPTGALLTTTGDTSAAAALAARYAAIIWSYYEDLWPESVRGLLVHSARWTEPMLEEFPHNERHNRLRCYGFGIPDLQGALWSASNSATLIIQGTLRPFDKSEHSVKTKDMHLHRLPWPTAVLQDLSELEVRMRVTLSYFIEPSPGRRGWTRKHRYQSHGLRFDVKRPLETGEAFHKRISKAAWDEDEEIEHGSDDRNWELGDQLRRKGSLHSDTWSGTAAQLADCGVIAVFPITGWWKERPHLNRWNREARYSLIVTIETPETEVDLYTPIAMQIGIPVETAIEA